MFRRVLIAALSLSLSVSSAFAARSVDVSHGDMSNSASASPALEIDKRVMQESQALGFSIRTQPIRSMAELGAFTKAAAARGEATLDFLSEKARTKFVNSLAYSDSGLSTFNYRGIGDELSATQAYLLLKLFGVESATNSIAGLRADNELDQMILESTPTQSKRMAVTVIDNYRCEPPATCVYSFSDQCIADNCK